MSPSKTVLIEQIEELVTPVLKEQLAEVVDIQFVHEHGQWVLRFFLDKERGITLDDCATISDHLGQVLDAADIIPHGYSLEVSSPGLDRPLRKEDDYRRFIGQRVDISLFLPVNGRRHFKGTIEAVEPGQVVVRDATEALFTLPLTAVAKGKLDPEITF